jgi:Icc-related predicted phosphoesterase
MIRFVGDVHAKFNDYLTVIDKAESSIQVGDFGLGFKWPEPEVGNAHRFIRGNHDNPEIARTHPRWIPDGHIEMTHLGKMLFVGGAESIDKHLRVEGVSWWRDEELSYQALCKIVRLFEDEKPDVIVSHDCPRAIIDHLFPNMFPTKKSTTTSQALDTAFEIHKPALWVHGHWHVTARKTILGTDFMCLGELAFVDL